MNTYLNPSGENNNLFNDCPIVLQTFLNYSTAIKNLSARTINAYYIDLRMFFRYLKIKNKQVPADMEFCCISISNITMDTIQAVEPQDIYDFLSFATIKLKNSAACRCRKLSSIKSFYKYWCVTMKKIENNPAADIESPKLPNRVPKYLSLEESMTLLTNIRGDLAIRDYCMTILFLNCGMRVSELVGIDLLDIKDNTLKLVGKGNKERIVYLNNACLNAIENYRTERSAWLKNPKEHALFISKQTGKRLTVRRIEQIINKALKLSGLAGQGYSVHKLRHTAATLLYQSGHADMLTLKEMLGHKHVSTTEIYTHISPNQLVEAAENSPFANVNLIKKIEK